MQTRCPHCHQPIEILDDSSLSGITCPTCDSEFSLVDDKTLTFREDEHRTIGHFELRQKLGMGAFGSVWKAHDNDLDRTVAIKIPREAQLSSRDAELFLREARAAAQLKHPHIVSVHEVGRVGDTTFIVSDFVEGLNLADRLTGQPFSFVEAATLCMKMAGALEHAHQEGVVHRDLKPSNIMLDSSGEPHIMDFGLAKRDVGEITMTIDGAVLGTPAYMSPEQARGQSHDADARSDMYSLGVILFQLLTGELPFRGNTRMLIHQVIHDDPPSPRKLNGAVPRDLETICLKCLAKEPGQRYWSAGQLNDDLRRFINGEAVLAQPPSVTYRVRKYVKRNRGPMTAFAIIMLVLVGGVAASSWFAISAVDSRHVAEIRQHEADLARDRANEEAKSARNAEAREKIARTAAEQSRERAERLQNDISVNAGKILCQSGSVRHGLLLLAKGIADAPHSMTPHLKRYRGEFSDWVQSIPRLERVIYAPDAHRRTDKGSVFAVSNSCRYVAANRNAGRNRDLQVWNTETGRQLPMSELPASKLTRSIAFSPNEKFLMVGTDAGECIRIEIPHQRKPASIDFRHKSPVVTMDISNDGMLLAVGLESGQAFVWKMESPGADPVLIGLQAGVWEVAFDSTGDQLVTASVDGTARVWSTTTGAPLTGPLRHSTDVFCAAFSPDGKTLATGCGDGYARLWDIGSGQHLEQFQFQDSSKIVSVAFHPDGNLLATGCQSTSARLWNLDTLRQQGETIKHNSTVGRVSFADNGEYLCTTSHREARKWKFDNTSTHRALPHVHCVGALAFHPEGKLLLTGTAAEPTGKGQTQMWDVAQGTTVGHPIEHPDSVVSVDFSPTGDRFLVGTGHISHSSGEAALYDTMTSQLIGNRIPHSGGALAVAFSPDGKLFATGGHEQTVRIWDATTPETRKVQELRVDDSVIALKFAPHTNVLAVGLNNNNCLLWDRDSGESAKLEIRGAVAGVAFSPDGQTMVTAGGDPTARLWNMRTNLQTGQIFQHMSDYIRPVMFSPDGGTLLTGGGDKRVRLWDVTTGQLVRSPLKHSSSVFAAAFSPDGKTVASGGGNPYPIVRHGEVRLWHLASSEGIPANNRLVLWTELLTGMRLNEVGQAIHLDPKEWLQRNEEWRTVKRQ